MEVRTVLQADYAIEGVTEVKDVSSSTPCYLVVAGERSYIFKKVDRKDFLHINDRVGQLLVERGFAQGRVIRTTGGAIMSSTGYSLHEFIPGETMSSFTDSQFAEVVQYLRRYTEALQEIPFDPDEIEELNIWDKVKSVEFLVNNVDRVAANCSLDDRAQVLLRQAAALLSQNMDFFRSSPKQLIHSDLGPDNILLLDGQVHAIIDFTPEYEHELYSLAQFIYWNCLWKYDETTSLPRIQSILDVYYGAKEGEGEQSADPEALFLYMVKACLFRIMGPALNMVENDKCDPSRLQGRLSVLETLCSIREGIWGQH